MTVLYGLQPSGFVLKPFTEIQLELQQAYQGQFGAGVPLDGNSVFGQQIGIHSERESDLWQLLQGLYLSIYPDTATGVALSQAVSLTGHQRLAPAYSTATLTLTGTNGTVIPSGFQVEVAGTSNVFQTSTTTTIAGGTGSIPVVCTVAGAITAPAGTLTTILTPIAGLTSVTNAANAITGVAIETDAALRTRRLASITISQGGTAASIQNAVTQVTGVTFCGVRMNRGDVTDSSGRPPHSYETVVIGGTDQSVANAIWAAASAGAALYGTYAAQSVTDSFGTAQPVLFTRGTNVPMFLDVTIGGRTAGYPGDSTVEAQLVAYVNGLGYGQSVNNWSLIASLAGIPGITSVVILQGTAFPATSSANTAMTPNQVPTLNTGSITMH